MDALQDELRKLQRDASYTQSITDVEKIIQQLETAREAIAAEPNSASITLAKLQNPLKHGFDKVTEDLRKIHKGHNAYGKALDKNFPKQTLPTTIDALASQDSLINRAIAMHLLREGQFTVASTFLKEAEQDPPLGNIDSMDNDSQDVAFEAFTAAGVTELTSIRSQELQAKFANMYKILNDLKQLNLLPAIAWARGNSAELERRGSTLEFELTKLQYVWLFQGSSVNGLGDDEHNGLVAAFNYGRTEFPRFQKRFSRDIQQLLAAMAYHTNIPKSPYSHIFNVTSAWSDIASSFTRDFCSLLGLSAESPLYLATTAGAIALPTLLKLAKISKEKHTAWSTDDELPVEIPLPKAMIFHQIFVCPVSKEQSTEMNPPMMMPCGHVIAKESLQRLSKGGRFKCPYCPGESQPKDAREIIL